ncbi:hypothetical protein MLD38_017973 [Melastoma candidum]|uniref:Uncharacterized protein n=1 Tax=Melastoma candidum TaxID=119954 RepID=A0ACB9QSX3_9MYRT|nr:hypothetical protein MLD38_017973 [Melastoma candidum]
MLRKELRGGTLQSLLSGTRGTSNTFLEPDPLLSSFIFSPTVDASVNVEPQTADEASLLEDSSDEEILERDARKSLLPGEDQEERTQKCEFVQELFLSTFLGGDDMSSKQRK